MKFVLATIALLSFAKAGLSVTVQGIDVSDMTQVIDRSRVAAQGVGFVYIKTSKGISESNNAFPKQFTGAANLGLITGAYHIAVPNMAPGSAQASFFLSHGGTWNHGGSILPGALKLEKSPSGNGCYGLIPNAMVGWIHDFSDVYHARTGRYPVIYTTTDWWKTCTGNSPVFGATNPLWISQLSSSPGVLPNGWRYYTFLQGDDKGPNPGSQIIFNGPKSSLQGFAMGGN
jgi:GH25 family lysozyme M1 (1,4-beta-N-acetylmuramidase)